MLRLSSVDLTMHIPMYSLLYKNEAIQDIIERNKKEQKPQMGVNPMSKAKLYIGP
jgi:hypothetical protein